MSDSVARAGTGLRLLRAAVFAAVCVVLSGGGHALASRTGVPPWALAAGFLAVLAVSVPLAGRERSLPGIAAALAAGQFALHAFFGCAQHAAAPAAAAATGAPAAASHAQTAEVTALAARLLCGEGPTPLSAAEAHRVVTAAGIDPGSVPTPPSGARAPLLASALPSLVPSLPMLLAHLLAALVLGLLLRRGEAALFRLVRLSARGLAEGALVRSLRAAVGLARALRTGLPGGHGSRTVAPYVYGDDKAGSRVVLLEHSVSRRGPPHFRPAA